MVKGAEEVMRKEIDKAWQTDTYRKLAKAYYEGTVRDFAINDALSEHGITYIKDDDCLNRAIEELLDEYDTDLCTAIIDLAVYREVTFVDEHDRDVICTTIDELLDVYGLTDKEGLHANEKQS